MTNDEYIAFLSNLPDEPQPGDIRKITLGFAQHVVDLSNGLYRAFNDVAERLEARVEGNDPLKVVAGQEALERVLVDIRYQMAQDNTAREKNAAQVADFLEHQGKKLDALGTQLKNINTELLSLKKRVTASEQRQDRARERLDAHDQAIVTIQKNLDQRDSAITHQLAELKRGNADARAQLDTTLELLAELGRGINGRLTDLIVASKAAARAEGRDEERAHPGSG